MKTKKVPRAPLDEDPILTAREVCKVLRCNNKTLYRRRRDGLIVGIPVNSRTFLYRESVIRKYLANAEAGVFAPEAIRGATR
jgi:predicted site-specific integrase-resolvase